MPSATTLTMRFKCCLVCSAKLFRAAIAAPYIFTCKHFQPLRGKWIYYKGMADIKPYIINMIAMMTKRFVENVLKKGQKN